LEDLERDLLTGPIEPAFGREMRADELHLFVSLGGRPTLKSIMWIMLEKVGKGTKFHCGMLNGNEQVEEGENGFEWGEGLNHLRI
jgi:hypothetical protein